MVIATNSCLCLVLFAYFVINTNKITSMADKAKAEKEKVILRNFSFNFFAKSYLIYNL